MEPAAVGANLWTALDLPLSAPSVERQYGGSGSDSPAPFSHEWHARTADARAQHVGLDAQFLDAQYTPVIDFNTILTVLDRSQLQHTCAEGPSEPPYQLRPAYAQDIDASRIFVEGTRFKRADHYGRSHQIDCWRSSGGKKGGTVIIDTKLHGDVCTRRFRRQYGRIDLNKKPTGRRYRSYVEIDEKDGKFGPTMYVILLDSNSERKMGSAKPSIRAARPNLGIPADSRKKNLRGPLTVSSTARLPPAPDRPRAMLTA